MVSEAAERRLGTGQGIRGSREKTRDMAGYPRQQREDWGQGRVSETAERRLGTGQSIRDSREKTRDMAGYPRQQRED